MMSQCRWFAAFLFLNCHLARSENSLHNVASRIKDVPKVEWKDIEDELVAMINTDSALMTEDMKKTVERTVKMLDDKVIAKVIKSYQNDVKTFKALMTAFEVCEAERQEMKNSITDKETIFDESRKHLIQCRMNPEGEAPRHHHWTECQDVEKALRGEMEQECGEYANEVAKFRGLADNCKEQGKNGYVTHVTWNEQAFQIQIDKHDKEAAECNNATESYNHKVGECKLIHWGWKNKKATCKAEQDAIEVNSCFRLDDTLEMNKRYSKCYNPTLTNYQRTVLVLKKAENDRNQEWSAVERIKCFLAIFTLKTNKEKTDQIETCKNKDFTTTKYNLVYRPAYVKASRKRILPFACTDEFIAKYYKGKFDPEWAPQTRCRWCSGFKPTPPPTPEPTPKPTPFPTPPPTKKPTPAPTKAKGEGCKIWVYTKENLSTKNGGKRKIIKYRNTRFQKYIQDNIVNNGGMASFKATGDQCKFCFYSKSNFFGKLLGSRIPLKSGRLIVKKTTTLKKTRSIKIIDSRFATKCPPAGSGM